MGTVRRINCTQCAAPLELLGGHKVERIVCSYCGSMLDGGEGYRVLKAHYAQRGKRAHLPLQPGDEGTIKGVIFTVIGFIAYRADEDAWTEFCLFSPTHGYSWLSWEKGHYLFVRRLRDLPSPSGSWHSFKVRQPIRLGASKFKFYEAYSARVTDIGGELPWRGEIGDRIRAADAVAPPQILSRESEGNEVEFYLGEYLPAEQVAESFGKPALARHPVARSVHPAQPFVVSPVDQSVERYAQVFGAMVLLLLLYVLISGNGETLVRQSFAWSEIQGQGGALTQPFEITSPRRLVKVSLDSSASNAWLWLDLDVSRQGEEVFSLGKEISYYEGYEGGESWSEGSQGATALFRVPEAGTYELKVTASESGGRYNSPISVVVEQGVLLARWFLILLLLLLPAALWVVLRRMLFEGRRWAPVTGDEGDD